MLTYIVKKYKRRKKDLLNQPQIILKNGNRNYILIITLNVSGLNAPTKRHRLAEWIPKKKPIYVLSARNPFQT